MIDRFGSEQTLFALAFWTLKSTVWIGLAAIAAVLLRHRSAAVRHAVWTAGIVGALALPLLGGVLPSLRSPWIPRVTSGSAPSRASAERSRIRSATIPAPGARGASDRLARRDVRAAGVRKAAPASADLRATQVQLDGVVGAPGMGGPTSLDVPAARPAAKIDLAAWLVAVWLAGALFLIAFFAAGHLSLHRVARAAAAPDGLWPELARAARSRLGLKRSFRLVRSEAAAMPMTCGVVRPVVIVPAAADAWRGDRRLLVLLHELAHIERLDCLTQMFAQFVCALLWFHPAVWFAAARMREEREKACDDRVLGSEPSASRYAGHLLEIVRELKSPGLMATGAVAFARPSRFEGRLVALLRSGADRSGLDLRAASRVAAFALLLSIPLAMLQPGSGSARNATKTSSSSRDVQIVHVPDPDAPLAERIAWARKQEGRAWIAYSISHAATGTHRVIGDSNGLDLSTLDSDDHLSRWIDLDEGGGPWVVVLMRFDGDRDPVRLRYQSPELPADLGGAPLYWLGDASDEESLRWLGAWRSRADGEMAKEVLDCESVHGRSELVVPRLVGVLEQDGDDQLRAQAAEGLAHHPSGEVVQLLGKAAHSDRSTDVRRQATEALGQVGSPAATRILIDLVRNSDEDVRQQAIESLSEHVVNDPEAIAPEAAQPAQPAQPAMPSWAPPAPGTPMVPTTPMPAMPKHFDLTPEQRAALEAATDRHADAMDRAADAIDRMDQAKDRMGEALSRVDQAMDSMAPDDATPPEDATPPVEVIPRRDRIKRHPTPEAIRSAVEQDQRREVQRQAVESIGRLPEAISLPQLVRVLDGSYDPDVQRQAMESIGRIDSPAARRLVTKYAWHHAEESVRGEAVELMARTMAEKQALATLSEIADKHPDSNTRRRAVETVGRFEGAESRRILEDVIAHGDDADVQRQAVESLGRRDEPGILEALTRIARTHRSADVRRQAVEMIGHFDPEQAARVLEQLLDH